MAGPFMTFVSLVMAWSSSKLRLTSPVEPLGDDDIVKPGPFEGPFRISVPMGGNNTQRVLDGAITGPEHIAIKPGSPQLASNSNWELWTVGENAIFYTVPFRGAAVQPAGVQEQFYAGPGRPLGFDWDAEGSMYIANSLQGLMKWQQRGNKHELLIVSNRVSASSPLQPGTPIAFADSVVVSRTTGKVYFTSSTGIPPPYSKRGVYDAMRACLLEHLTGAHSGMLLEYDPQSGTTISIKGGLWFSNGVAMPEDGSYVLMAETHHMRIWKIWLSGAKAGQHEVLIDNLPAWPDNLHYIADTGTFWQGLVAKPPHLMTTSHYKPKLIRELAADLPESALVAFLKLPPVGGGFEFDAEGKVVRVVADNEGQAAAATASGLVLNDLGLVVMSNLDYAYLTVTQLQ